jgi:hypothetical protein
MCQEAAPPQPTTPTLRGLAILIVTEGKVLLNNNDIIAKLAQPLGNTAPRRSSANDYDVV